MAAPVVGTAAEHGEHASGSLRGLTLAALGVAYGDIGTSPLYTLREAFGHAGGLHLGEAEGLGVLSLVFWSLVLIVSIKYVLLILRADNRGPGGVLALGALATRAVGDRSHRLQGLILVLSLGGLVLFYGDGLITPAISVLAAIEGLETADVLAWARGGAGGGSTITLSRPSHGADRQDLRPLRRPRGASPETKRDLATIKALVQRLIKSGVTTLADLG